MLETTAAVTTMTYAAAANAALRRALTEFPNSLYFGEDVGKQGGIFGTTKGLQNDFGSARVFDTPISETAMIGTAVGAAMTGHRPIVEIMWIDFSLVAVDQIVNQAANVRYVSQGRLTAPLTIRTQQGALPGSCAQHSQNLEALYAHIPGLRVGLPATPADAYAMLLAGIACDDPVLIIENRGLYFGAATEVDLDAPIEAIGTAHVTRPGDDLTVVTWSAMLGSALAAAERAAGDGRSVEVINARWLNPFDWTTVFASVAKTRRLLIVHEANVTGGFGAEIAARVSAHAFGALAAPVRRLGVDDCRIPAAPQLQAALIPQVDDIARAIADMTA
jgi:pyruvate/2-oxoglutarate/acetoin dehydrogenase E1 component